MSSIWKRNIWTQMFILLFVWLIFCDLIQFRNISIKMSKQVVFKSKFGSFQIPKKKWNKFQFPEYKWNKTPKLCEGELCNWSANIPVLENFLSLSLSLPISVSFRLLICFPLRFFVVVVAHSEERNKFGTAKRDKKLSAWA